MRLTLPIMVLFLLSGCYGMEYGLIGALAPMSHRPEEPDYPNATTYEEIEGVSVPDSLKASELLGTYSIRAGMHGGRTLRLVTDSTLSYHAFDVFFGFDMEGEGTWSLDGNTVRLNLPTFDDESDHELFVGYGHSEVLEVVTTKGRLLLVPLDQKEPFLRFGPEYWTVFH